MTHRGNMMFQDFWKADFGGIIINMDYLKFGSLDDESHQMVGSEMKII